MSRSRQLHGSWHPLFWLFAALLLAPGHLAAQATSGYTAPAAFMDLFFDFTGRDEPDYPSSQPTMGEMLAQAAAAREAATGGPGPLVLLVGSDIYVYGPEDRAQLGHVRFRANRTNGFYELTAISHIGPALAYLATLKEAGDDRWRARVATMRTHVAAVRALNRQTSDHWLAQLGQSAWTAHTGEIRRLVDYACAMTEDYLASIGDGESFTSADVNSRFFEGTSEAFPIPFNNVMVGTFMLEALRGAFEAHEEFGGLAIDWPRAMAVVSSQAGSNVSSGLTAGTNWLVFFLQALSGFTLPPDRIIIAPYADVRPSLGEAILPAGDFAYYAGQVWGPLYYRGMVADEAFAGIPTIYLPDRPPLPGDHGVTGAGDIGDFMVRLKHSLRDEREMLSNTVAYWMVQEMYDHDWDPAAVDVPGLTTGFPPGVAGYPAVAP
ncbi:MAG: DUF5624 domain-containing protein [Vicinamibacterales bacterium]